MIGKTATIRAYAAIYHVGIKKIDEHGVYGDFRVILSKNGKEKSAIHPDGLFGFESMTSLVVHKKRKDDLL